MSSVRIYYGEMGSGKTYLGKQDAEALGWTFLEGDDCIPPAMRERVLNFKSLPKKMIDDYVHYHLAPAIVAAAKRQNVVVAQALYRRKHRDYITICLAEEDIGVRWLLPKVSFMQNLKQLWSRPNGLKWVLYWLLSKPFFQGD